MLPTALGIVLMLGAPANENSNAPRQNGSSVHVECHGKLRSGVVAVGGETTGTEMSFEGITWELNLPDQATRAFAKEHHKKPVTVVGSLRQVRGIERPIRWIVDVEKLSSRNSATQKDGAQLTVVGMLHKNDVEAEPPSDLALDTAGITWPLDLSAEKTIRAKALSLLGKRVAVVGRPVKDKESNGALKLWLCVQKIEAAGSATPKS